jgi:ferredoxin
MLARSPGVLSAAHLGAMIDELRTRGYTVYAPVLDHGALVIRPIESVDRLPRGVIDDQGAGTHRLRQEGERCFDYTAPADSWKRLFFPPRLRMWRSTGEDGRVTAAEEPPPEGRAALLGVRGCDLAAIRVQDRVFLGGAHPDPHYRSRRENAFIVAINCARATSTCFCPSMGTGPQAGPGHDLSLTELTEGGFYVEAASDRGADVLGALPVEAATDSDAKRAAATVAATAASITRTMPADIAQTLRGAFASPRWQAIADRCLSCGNCTLVCPTCFCSAVEHTTDLEGNAFHERRWDSCFTAGHSYIHGGSVRGSTAPRYRQWLTHKLSTWHDQFGTSGCTGCGRCIAWCPVAIDITAEAHAFTADAVGGRA